jgi:hypothetical protein
MITSMRVRLKTAALLALFAGIGGFVAIDAVKDSPVPRGAPERDARARPPDAGTQAPAADAAPSDPQPFLLPDRAELGASRSPLFASQSWQPPPPRVRPQPPPPPTAPPLPFKFAGKLVQEGRLSVLLAKGDSVIPVKEGETLDGTYRLESITDTQITLVYLPLAQKQTLPVVTSLAAASQPAAVAAGATSLTASASSGGAEPGAPIPTGKVVAQTPPAADFAQATLAWGGPQQVKLGTRFEVTLRVHSSQPLRAWPMQLRVDPEHFEVVTVTPGKLPGGSDPNFTYRVNRDGSVSIGASVQLAVPAWDAQLLALTLRPLKLGSAAEVSIASLDLQGAAGRLIPYDRVATFRTAITP